MAPTDIRQRWKYLEDGATIAGSLAYVAQQGQLADVAAAVKALHRDQLEAAVFALALIHAHETCVVEQRSA